MTADAIVYADERARPAPGWTPAASGYFDENEQTRASLGAADLVTTATGAETHYPAAVVLYKPDGKVLWMQPSQ